MSDRRARPGIRVVGTPLTLDATQSGKVFTDPLGTGFTYVISLGG